MADEKPTWDNTIQEYFNNLGQIGCMRDVETANPRLDLGSYDSVVA